MAVKIQGSETPQETKQSNASFNQKKVIQMPTFGINSYLSTLGNGGEYYEALFEKIKKRVDAVNQANKNEQYQVTKVLKQTYGLNYSAIAISSKVTDKVAAHGLIIERTGDYPTPIIENISGTKYEIVRTPADAYDDKFALAIITAVAEQYKVNTSDVILVDSTLVPNEVDINNENAISLILNNAANAVLSELFVVVNDYKGINITEIISNNRDGKFIIDLYFNQDGIDYFDQTGMPIRQDICVSLKFKMNNTGNNRSVNVGDNVVDILKVYGYVDFEFTGPTIINGMIPGTQKFVPNFVITHIESHVAPTPDILMLAIACSLSVNEDLNWLQSYRPTPMRKGEIDLKDIGALNIEGNIENNPTGYGKKYDTKSKTFNAAELTKFVTTLVKPNIIISIDVPKAGPETWYTSVLQFAKMGSKDAIKRINESLVVLTNGAYSPQHIPMFVDVSNKFHGGYYKTKDGIRDIRHISNYLAVANYVAETNQSPALITNYTNTLYNVSIPAEFRSAERKRFIDELSSNSAVYKQYFERLTFTGMFLSNLVNSLKIAGFMPIANNMGLGTDIFARRAMVDFSNAMLDPNARIMGNNNMYGGFYAANAYHRTF